ncbi:MAG: carboxypeptidase regulatory-like domain-containing protein [Haloplanus sp.]
MSPNADLRIDTAKATYRVGEGVVVRVRDTAGTPMPGATVSSSTGWTGQTGANGNATVRIDDPGQLKLTAAKPGTQNVSYTPATTLIRMTNG